MQDESCDRNIAAAEGCTRTGSSIVVFRRLELAKSGGRVNAWITCSAGELRRRAAAWKVWVAYAAVVRACATQSIPVTSCCPSTKLNWAACSCTCRIPYSSSSRKLSSIHSNTQR